MNLLRILPVIAAVATTTAGHVARTGGAALPGAPGGVGLEPHALGEALAGALDKTEAKADADIASEIVEGGYRIGLVLGPGRAIRPRNAAGAFTEPSTSDPDISFVGVVLREPRTKRFLPAADVKVILEYEGGNDVALDELIGPYPIYGKNLRLPAKGMRGISVVVGPPAYNRHAEMLSAFTGEGAARFELVEKKGSKKVPNYEVVDPKKPAPIASDWKIGDDLRQAAGEARAWQRDGDYAIGFVVEGPEPIWLWQGAKKAPSHCPPGPKDTNHVEAVVVHMASGLNVTEAAVGIRFWRRTSRSAPPEQHDYLLRPLLADFYHYGLTTEIPPGTWVVQIAVAPPATAAWGNDLHPPAPEDRVQAIFQHTREAPLTAVNAPGQQAVAFAARLDDAAAQYGNGDREGATKIVVDTFFAFEGSGLDAQLKARDTGAYKSLETNWIAVRAKMEAGEDPAAVTSAAAGVAATLRALAADAAAPQSGSSAFVQSFFVLLREGFEAILVLSLLVGVLRKTGKTEAVRLVYGGAAAAVVASILLAVVSAMIFRKVELGSAREAFEGFTLLASVVVLFFTSYWLLSRVEGKRWAMFVKHQIEGAIGSGRRFAIGSLAFLVVFREGAETVLFYAGLFASSHGATAQILGGIALATLGLIALFFATIVGGAKLPVRPFFAITGALLYLLAFKFAGDAFAELQASGLVGRAELSWIPKSSALQSWLGIYPTVQTSLAQGVLVFAVVAGIAWTIFSRPRGSESTGGAVAG